ncbi:hypothetical protein OIU84_015441 [Salix udensis]|uniref:Pentatricopeptide repeat-containing protein n=1 Tax=Salix udensis TaxID=889485 RepID=A0AAD6NSK0_9ROSI|nr:hypothetical protein OIU84_015441 [Salix udensis]
MFLWTAILSGLAQNLKLREAVVAFQEMEASGVLSNNFTYLSILNACSLTLSLDLGRQIHARVIMTGLEDDLPVGIALVDMYMKCSHGAKKNGLRMFQGIQSPDVISWTSSIAGLSEHGFHPDSFDLYMEMTASGLQPNSVTLSTILGSPCLCSGNERVDEAWDLIRNMSQRDALTYTRFGHEAQSDGPS